MIRFEKSEDTNFLPAQRQKIRKWLLDAVKNEKSKAGNITYIFCTDDYLHQINVEYLQHDTLTDIITFPYSYDPVETDMYISIDRIRDNAEKFEVSFETELHRVMIHGLLHMMGYDDKTAAKKQKMREKEDEYLSKLNELVPQR